MKAPGTLRQCLAVMTNPASVISRFAGDLGLPVAVGIPALAFGLFFLQTALDLEQAGKVGPFLGGLITGAVGIPVLALVVWVLTRPFGDAHGLGWTVRAFGMAYSPALLYGVFGLAANLLLDWNTALAFGVTGVLWTLSPIFATIRQMTGERRRLSMTLAGLVGFLVLATWAAMVGG